MLVLLLLLLCIEVLTLPVRGGQWKLGMWIFCIKKAAV